jgi:hypothetical protein
MKEFVFQSIEIPNERNRIFFYVVAEFVMGKSCSFSTSPDRIVGRVAAMLFYKPSEIVQLAVEIGKILNSLNQAGLIEKDPAFPDAYRIKDGVTISFRVEP